MSAEERRSEALADQRARIAETVSTPAGAFLSLISAEGTLREDATLLGSMLRPAPAELQAGVYRSPSTDPAWAEFEAQAVPYLDTLVRVRDLLLDGLRNRALPGSYYVEQRQRAINAESDFYLKLMDVRTDACAEVSSDLGDAASEHFARLIEGNEGPVVRGRFSDGEPWAEAEQLAAEYLQGLSVFGDVRRTAGGADAGLDLAGRSLVAQVKYLSKPVGRPELQRLVGANVEDRLMACFSRAGFTEQAMDYAEQHDIALFNIELPDEVSPTNDFAYAVLRAG